jgi:hypothetical protein
LSGKPCPAKVSAFFQQEDFMPKIVIGPGAMWNETEGYLAVLVDDAGERICTGSSCVDQDEALGSLIRQQFRSPTGSSHSSSNPEVRNQQQTENRTPERSGLFIRPLFGGHAGRCRFFVVILASTIVIPSLSRDLFGFLDTKSTLQLVYRGG